MPRTTLGTSKFEVCLAQESDFSRMAGLYNDNYSSLMNVDLLKADRFAEKGRYDFVVYDQVGLVATAALQGVCFRDLRGALGYVVREDARGQKVATELVEFVLKFGFEVLGLTKITAHCLSGYGGQHVAKKVGMEQEAVLRAEIFKNGRYTDVLVFSLARGSRCPNQ